MVRQNTAILYQTVFVKSAATIIDQKYSLVDKSINSHIDLAQKSTCTAIAVDRVEPYASMKWAILPKRVSAYRTNDNGVDDTAY